MRGRAVVRIMLTVLMCIFTVISLLIYLTMLAMSDYTV